MKVFNENNVYVNFFYEKLDDGYDFATYMD